VPGLDRTNLPRNISYVARDVAKYMGVEEEVLKARARENTERIFQVLP
jgi:TatD DNase family protein